MVFTDMVSTDPKFIQTTLAQVVSGHDLPESVASEVMNAVMKGEVSSAQLGALLAGLKLKGVTTAEVTGFARALRQHVVPVRAVEGLGLVDTCGTGGGGGDTFNISTAAALVAAGAGARVAKHGNRSVTSRSGSADVLEALGVVADLPPEAVETSIAETGIGFMFAPRFHPGFRHAGPVRKEIGFGTIFNMLGPITNPAGVRRQVVGVSDPAFVRILAATLANLGAERVLVVHSSEGIDEIGLAGFTHVAEFDRDHSELREYEIWSEQFGLPAVSADAYRGGNPDENASIIRSVLDGAEGPHRDVVVMNAAAALYAAGLADSIAAAIPLAQDSIDGGRAKAVLAHFAETTQRLANTENNN